MTVLFRLLVASCQLPEAMQELRVIVRICDVLLAGVTQCIFTLQLLPLEQTRLNTSTLQPPLNTQIGIGYLSICVLIWYQSVRM